MQKRHFAIITAFLLAVSLLLSGLGGGETKAAQPDVLQELDRLSIEVLKLTEQGHLEEAKERLEELGRLFPQIGLHKKISIEALELASNTIVQGKQAYNPISPDMKEMLWHATQIRIMIDALSHPNQPIWKGYYTTYLEQVSKMIHLAGRKQTVDLNNALQENMNLYSILKPAFALNNTPSSMGMLDSLYNFLVQQTRQENVDWGSVQDSLEQLHQLSGNIFLGKEQNTFVGYISSNSPLAMISAISLILCTVLGYVAWRMYRGERYDV